ncbi:RAD9, HUS1, RAD1-interacting nuclear orphan protein 1 isoform X3 [Gorilla gorilla gorilla]|uniref:RAD9, HUS1, RAD1-interacting nuclear orphan protein 1 isoform X3 n=1 Tax=Gorilla gorilla gorilla TaxID=9595 RepID=UPI0008F53373|nr:RAD9, HUS1, RAD1-interacting nuclear orphan protein 1 isoform X3 [Gorilla gorilla gorilla]
MPPRKKRRQPSQKTPLLFHQQPLEGPKHSCASTQLPITHTRQVLSKPIDHSTITSWVSPDFDTAAGSLFPAYQKHQNRTPESSSVKEELIPQDQKENSLLSCTLHPGTANSPEPGPVLVEDTPEDKYGIKVTWRRRQHLLAYLRERGKLSRSQFLVKS